MLKRRKGFRQVHTNIWAKMPLFLLLQKLNPFMFEVLKYPIFFSSSLSFPNCKVVYCIVFILQNDPLYFHDNTFWKSLSRSDILT